MSAYKAEIMKTLCSTQSIVDLITNTTDTTVPATGLKYTKIFPYDYLEGCVEEAGTYICFDIDITEAKTFSILSARTYIWIITHSSLMRVPNKGTRLDLLYHAIVNELNGKHDMGIGMFGLAQRNPVTRFNTPEGYHGKLIVFDSKDFNLKEADREWI